MLDELTLRYAKHIKNENLAGLYEDMIPLYNILKEFIDEAFKLKDAHLKCCDATEKSTCMGVMVYHVHSQGCDKKPHKKIGAV